MVGLTDFLRNIQENPSLLSGVAGQGSGIKSIAGTSPEIEGGASTLRLEARARQIRLDNAESNASIQQKLRAQQNQFNQVTNENLVTLGQTLSDNVTQLSESLRSQGDLLGNAVLKNTDFIISRTSGNPQQDPLQAALSGVGDAVNNVGNQVSGGFNDAGKGINDFLSGNVLGIPTSAILLGAGLIVAIGVLK